MRQFVEKYVVQFFKIEGFNQPLRQQQTRPDEAEQGRTLDPVSDNHAHDCLDVHLHLAVFQQLQNLRIGNRPFALDSAPQIEVSHGNVTAECYSAEKPG